MLPVKANIDYKSEREHCRIERKDAIRSPDIKSREVRRRSDGIQQNPANQKTRENEEQIYTAPGKPAKVSDFAEERMIRQISAQPAEDMPPEHKADGQSTNPIKSRNAAYSFKCLHS